MRALDPVLQAAMNAGNYSPIVRAAILDPDDYSVIQYLDVVYFKMQGIDLEIEFYDPTEGFTETICLERGALIGDVEYTIFSGIYHLTTSYMVEHGRYICAGSLVEPAAINVPADVDYETLIRSVIDVGDMLCSFKNPMAAWLGYQFFPDGLKYATGHNFVFYALLKQKYLIHCVDNGINSILFFAVSDVLNIASQYTITLNAADRWSVQTLYRQFAWKDENKTLHAPGPATYPVHNLGYLETSASPPPIPSNVMQVGETLVTVSPPNLKYQTGDCVKFDPGISGYVPVKSVLEVTEIFDARGKNKKKPVWYQELRPLQYFTNTSGGFVPTSVQYTSAYINLATYGFNGNLDASVTDLQKLADYLDDLDILLKSGNLAGLADAAAARTNLGLGGLALIDDAPADGSTYGRKNSAWEAISAGGAATFEDTRANILAATKDSGTFARSTDSNQIFISLGSGTWKMLPFPLVDEDAAPDMGYTQESSPIGISSTDITGKGLHSVWLGGYYHTPRRGAIKTTLENLLQVYLAGTWKTVVTGFELRENPTTHALEHKPVGYSTWIRIMDGNSIDSIGMNGRCIVQGYQVSMGAYPIDES